MIYLDTHVVAWLYEGEVERFSRRARDEIEANDLVICPVVLLELQYLREIKKLVEEPHVIYERLAHAIGLRTKELSFTAVVEEAILQHWTRDPFDRIIVAQATVDAAPLLTKDRSILRHYRGAFWSRRR